MKFACGIAALPVLFALFKLGWYIHTRLELALAEKAEKQKQYLTEQRRLQQLLQSAPASREALEHLVIASFYNQDIALMAAASRQLEEQLENDRQNLPAELMQLRTKMQYYQPFAAADALLRRYNNDLLAVPAVVYRQYTIMYPHDLYTLTNLYATACLSNNAFEAADSLLNKALSIDSTYAVALRLKIAVKQEQHQPDSALLYCNRMLAINRECVTAMAAKARILLRKGDKREGLSLATQSFLLDSTNGYAMATLAIAYHCNRRFRERDALMLRALTDSVLNSYMQYAKDVASGRESFFIK